MVQGAVRLARRSQLALDGPGRTSEKIARKNFRVFGAARATGRDPGVRLRSAFAL